MKKIPSECGLKLTGIEGYQTVVVTEPSGAGGHILELNHGTEGTDLQGPEEF